MSSGDATAVVSVFVFRGGILFKK